MSISSDGKSTNESSAAWKAVWAVPVLATWWANGLTKMWRKLSSFLVMPAMPAGWLPGKNLFRHTQIYTLSHAKGNVPSSLTKFNHKLVPKEN